MEVLNKAEAKLEAAKQALGRVVAGVGFYRLHRLGQRLFRRFELRVGLIQDLQRQHLRLLERTAEILIGLQDLVFALDLLVGRRSDIQVGLFDVVKATRDVAASDLHPHVADAFEGIDTAVFDLLNHFLSIITYAIE